MKVTITNTATGATIKNFNIPSIPAGMVLGYFLGSGVIVTSELIKKVRGKKNVENREG